MTPICRSPRITELFNRQSGSCAYCWTGMTLELGKPTTATQDHIIPKSRGGTSSIYNLVAVCYTCNQEKRDIPLSHFIGRFRQNFG